MEKCQRMRKGLIPCSRLSFGCSGWPEPQVVAQRSDKYPHLPLADESLVGERVEKENTPTCLCLCVHLYMCERVSRCLYRIQSTL